MRQLIVLCRRFSANIMSVFWLISAATGTVLTVGLGIFFFGPANLVFLIISVYLLLAAMRRS